MIIDNIKLKLAQELKEFMTKLYPDGDYKIRIFDGLVFNLNVEEINEHEIKVIDEYSDEPEPIDENTIIVMMQPLVGAFNKNTSVVPIQLSILSEEGSTKITEDFFNKFLEKYNNLKIDIIEEENNSFKVRQAFTNLVNMQNFIEMDIGYRSMFYMASSFIALRSIIGIDKIYVNDEEIDFEQVSIGYNAIQSSVQNTGDKIMKSVNQTATLTLQVVFNPALSNLTLNLRKIRKQINNSNYEFNIKIKDTDGAEEEYKMISMNHSISSGKTIPDLCTVNFTLSR